MRGSCCIYAGVTAAALGLVLAFLPDILKSLDDRSDVIDKIESRYMVSRFWAELFIKWSLWELWLRVVLGGLVLFCIAVPVMIPLLCLASPYLIWTSCHGCAPLQKVKVWIDGL